MTQALYYLDGPQPETPEPTQDQRHWRKTRVVGQAVPRVDAYQRLSNVIEGRGPYFITGRVNCEYDSPTVTATKIQKVPRTYLSVP